jgi:hypothetical protein
MLCKEKMNFLFKTVMYDSFDIRKKIWNEVSENNCQANSTPLFAIVKSEACFCLIRTLGS